MIFAAAQRFAADPLTRLSEKMQANNYESIDQS
jgi:hypothetical protein